MDLFKLDKYDKYFVAFILFIITLFSIGQCFANETENVDIAIVNGVYISANSNVFLTDSSRYVGYCQTENGYIYYIENVGGSAIRIAYSDNIPQVNGTYTELGLLGVGDTYTFSGKSYIYLDINTTASGNNVKVSRVKIDDMNGAIDGLVDNVGVNQLWGVFEGGIDFVGVIVLVAFGLFLVFLLVKKISKGKADF